MTPLAQTGLWVVKMYGIIAAATGVCVGGGGRAQKARCCNHMCFKSGWCVKISEECLEKPESFNWILDKRWSCCSKSVQSPHKDTYEAIAPPNHHPYRWLLIMNVSQHLLTAQPDLSGTDKPLPHWKEPILDLLLSMYSGGWGSNVPEKWLLTNRCTISNAKETVCCWRLMGVQCG